MLTHISLLFQSIGTSLRMLTAIKIDGSEQFGSLSGVVGASVFFPGMSRTCYAAAGCRDHVRVHIA